MFYILSAYENLLIKTDKRYTENTMKKAAKTLLIDHEGNYLLLYRNNHPHYGNDPDLPGGTVEKGESAKVAAIREVFEEVGIAINQVTELYSGLEYSLFGTHKTLFEARLAERPEVTLSWEHGSYEWLSRDEFLAKVATANDSYMHMVYKILRKSS